MSLITSIDEAIEIMGETNVITPQQVRDIGLQIEEYPLQIPRKILKWDPQKTIERREYKHHSKIPDLIATKNVKEIYYTPDKSRNQDHAVLKFPKPKFFGFLKMSKENKMKIWADFIQPNANNVWIVYDDTIKNNCPYVLFPGVNLNIIEMCERFPGIICYINDPIKRDCRADREERDKLSQKTITRKVPSGWYLALKEPERERFIKKNRDQQLLALAPHEEWGQTAEALLAGLLMRVIHEKNILTDYTHCNDWMYLNEGRWTSMIVNSIAFEGLARGNFIVTHNISFHSHRNSVMFVLIPLSGKKD